MSSNLAGWGTEGNAQCTMESDGFTPSSSSSMNMPMANIDVPGSGIGTVEVCQVEITQAQWLKYLFAGSEDNIPFNIINQYDVSRFFQNGNVGGTQEQVQGDSYPYYAPIAPPAAANYVMSNNVQMVSSNVGQFPVGNGQGIISPAVVSSAASSSSNDESTPTVVEAGKKGRTKRKAQGGPKVRKPRLEILHKVKLTDDMSPERRKQVMNAKNCWRHREAVKEKIRKAAIEHLEM